MKKFIRRARNVTCRVFQLLSDSALGENVYFKLVASSCHDETVEAQTRVLNRFVDFTPPEVVSLELWTCADINCVNL